MDAMVTARMPQGKKEAGNTVLDSLGVNPSQVINDLYDYLISHRQLPIELQQQSSGSSDQIEEALDWLRDISSEPHQHFSVMSVKEARRERLSKKQGR